jgi:predicted AAA+ superfamily ATPase
MIEQYHIHNLHLEGLERFENNDPQLARLKDLKFRHPMDWWCGIDWNSPGIFILTGGRQIGKTTSTKLLMLDRLKKGVFAPEAIFYLPCDELADREHLSRVVRSFLEGLKSGSGFLLIIDEVTFVREWARTVKALADEGWFKTGFCVITGSDSDLLKEAMNSFPGRRGGAAKGDFHLSPLDFPEYLNLVAGSPAGAPGPEIESLYAHFSQFLACGGYLKAINDLHMFGEVRASTYATFEQWIRGDFLKRGKSERTLLELLQTLLETGSSQVSYSRLTERTGTVTKETVIDYCGLLERMDLIFELESWDQNKKRGSPKKARKFHFSDPFIRRTVTGWLARESMIGPAIDEGASVESCVAAQYRRFAPAYYLKADSEIDLLLLLEGGAAAIEVKWTDRIRHADLRQLKKMDRAVILSKTRQSGFVEGIKIHPLPAFLASTPETASLSSEFTP